MKLNWILGLSRKICIYLEPQACRHTGWCFLIRHLCIPGKISAVGFNQIIMANTESKFLLFTDYWPSLPLELLLSTAGRVENVAGHTKTGAEHNIYILLCLCLVHKCIPLHILANSLQAASSESPGTLIFSILPVRRYCFLLLASSFTPQSDESKGV